MINPASYLGHESQLYGTEEHRLVGGKGDGMRLLLVRSGGGLEFTLSLDRAADISRLSYKGVNYGFFAPCGYVAPTYYDGQGAGFLKSFTAGFLTTCGLRNVGSPCEDEGEALPLHGTVSHIPAEQVNTWADENNLYIRATVRDAALFAHGLLLERTYTVPLLGNELTVTDRITNIGTTDTPLQMLYHFNMGYPLLDEHAILRTSATEPPAPRNAHAAEGIATACQMEPPQRGYEEMCFYHKMEGRAEVSVFSPSVGRGLVMSYDTASLPYFTEWKMMGERDYVLGIEPGNTLPDGRDVMRTRGELEILRVGACKTHEIHFTFTEKQ